MLSFNRLVAGWLAFCYGFASMLAGSSMMSQWTTGVTWLFFLLAMLGLLVIFIICDEVNRPRH